jgi:hypothetical protein
VWSDLLTGTPLAQDVVRRRDVEPEVLLGPAEQIILPAEGVTSPFRFSAITLSSLPSTSSCLKVAR